MRHQGHLPQYKTQRYQDAFMTAGLPDRSCTLQSRAAIVHKLFIPARGAFIWQEYRGRTMKKRILSGITASAFAAAFTPPAAAAVTFDPVAGSGFVNKGDVQLAFGLDNSQFQSQAGSVAFSAVSEKIEEVSWVCTNDRNEDIQERERTTTTSKSGIASTVARDSKKQASGFNLLGYTGVVRETTTTEGNPLNACPIHWVLTPAVEPVLVSSTSALTATLNGVTVTLRRPDAGTSGG